MNIELSLQEEVDGVVQRKRGAGRAADTATEIEVEAPRTLHEEGEFGAAQEDRASFRGFDGRHSGM